MIRTQEYDITEKTSQSVPKNTFHQSHSNTSFLKHLRTQVCGLLFKAIAKSQSRLTTNRLSQQNNNIDQILKCLSTKNICFLSQSHSPLMIHDALLKEPSGVLQPENPLGTWCFFTPCPLAQPRSKRKRMSPCHWRSRSEKPRFNRCLVELANENREKFVQVRVEIPVMITSS